MSRNAKTGQKKKHVGDQFGETAGGKTRIVKLSVVSTFVNVSRREGHVLYCSALVWCNYTHLDVGRGFPFFFLALSGSLIGRWQRLQGLVTGSEFFQPCQRSWTWVKFAPGFSICLTPSASYFVREWLHPSVLQNCTIALPVLKISPCQCKRLIRLAESSLLHCKLFRQTAIKCILVQ